MADTIESLQTDLQTVNQAIADAETRIATLNTEIEPLRVQLRDLITQRQDTANTRRLLKNRQEQTQLSITLLQQAAAKAQLADTKP